MEKKSYVRKLLGLIVILFTGSLFYAVYFTELGKPAPENKDPFTRFDQTAIPTLFTDSSNVPTVTLNWAIATKDSLRVAILVRDLTVEEHPDDLICRPYLRIEDLIRQELVSVSINPIYDSKGMAYEAIYGYEIEIDSPQILTVDMDITLGPCGFYIQGAHATPIPIPDLIGNYHFRFQVPVD